MSHYCTLFDRGYLAQGLVLLRSLKRHDPGMTLWVLCLDEDTQRVLEAIGGGNVRLLTLAGLETADPTLTVARANRSRVEFIFTLSPCLPRYLLTQHPEIDVITYVDADMQFASSPQPVFDALGDGNVLVVEHGFPFWLARHNDRGRFNVGVLCFRNNDEGRRCLDWWRERCLEWCRDIVEPGRYADQKYLDAWPELFRGVVDCMHPGVNVAPWNWMTRRWRIEGESIFVSERPLVVFHFAALRRLASDRLDSSQLEYAVMPFRLRNRLYGRYAAEIDSAAIEIATVLPRFTPVRAPSRGRRARWKSMLFQLLFGAVWTRHGGWWFSWSVGLGRWSGRVLGWWRGSLTKG